MSMKLSSFRIQNYKSIIDTGEISLSLNDRIKILAGQNESGKSSILEALYAYEEDEFDEDSKPFMMNNNSTQSISCSYLIQNHDSFIERFKEYFCEEFEIKNDEDIFDSEILCRIKNFTLIREYNSPNSVLKLNRPTIDIIKASILNRDNNKLHTYTLEDLKNNPKTFNFSEDSYPKLAQVFWRTTPKMLLFNEFCDLLPDSITLADLKKKDEDLKGITKGYKAVKNLERILDFKFISLFSMSDLERGSFSEEHNDSISVDFQKAWGQKIHEDNEFKIKYEFQKRELEDRSYINFFIETKKGQRIKPRLRSKGLIWFLSFWLELQAQHKNYNNLVIMADEPGLYLHVKAQSDILKLFEFLAKEGNQIIYSTHSPNLIDARHLNRIDLVINDEKIGTTIEPVTTCKLNGKIRKDGLQPVIQAIGFSRSDFSEFKKKNVILEGLSDFYYFLAMKSLFNKEDAYGFLPSVGVRKIESLISLCIGYEFHWLVVMDDDPAIGGKDSLNKYDEIKKYVFSEDDGEIQKHVYILKGIDGIENMFSFEDLELISTQLVKQKNLSKSVGEYRKILFAREFFEKVQAGKIKKENISQKAIENFDKVFNWIDENFGAVT
jgi:predicted ATP-dependent endonuclease of OLD family